MTILWNFRGFVPWSDFPSVQWLTVNFYHQTLDVITWVNWSRGWHPVGTLRNPRLNYWYHICLEVDTKHSKITAAVNGELMGTVEKTNITNSPTNLQMVLGKRFKEQLQGSVTNIQVFTVSAGHNTTALSAKPSGLQGDLLAWHAGDWKVEGARWILAEESQNQSEQSWRQV